MRVPLRALPSFFLALPSRSISLLVHTCTIASVAFPNLYNDEYTIQLVAFKPLAVMNAGPGETNDCLTSRSRAICRGDLKRSRNIARAGISAIVRRVGFDRL